MTPTLRRRLWLALFAAVLAGLVAFALWPRPVPVETAGVRRGPLRITVDEDGKTRVKERYIVSAPLAGRLQRILLDPGDAVNAGQTLLAVIEPLAPELLDERSRLRAEAGVKAAEAAHERALAELERAREAAQQCAGSYLRFKELAASGFVSRQEFDDVSSRHNIAREEEKAARFAVQVAEFELSQARAALLRVRPDQRRTAPDGPIQMSAPVDGRVLRVFHESATVVAAGDPLLELGDAQALEVEIDVLSSDAVRIVPGAPVLFEYWGGDEPLSGRVRLVEPAAYTKISALGVEEQRVNVVVDLNDPPDRRAALGDGYRVEARIVIWEGEEILKVPAGALFRNREEWAVFVVEGEQARLQEVRIGMGNGLESQVLEGLREGDLVIIHPGDKVADGVAVAAGAD